jgi:hypothetical protein
MKNLISQYARRLLHRHPCTTLQSFDINTYLMEGQSQTSRLLLHKKSISL